MKQADSLALMQLASLKLEISQYHNLVLKMQAHEVGSDEFVLMQAKLDELEKAHPHLVQTKGSIHLSEESINPTLNNMHSPTVLEHHKSNDLTTISDFMMRCKKSLHDRYLSFTCGYKPQGIGVVLTYQSGLLSDIRLHGDGVYGDSLPEELASIFGIPVNLNVQPIMAAYGGLIEDIPKRLRINGYLTTSSDYLPMLASQAGVQITAKNSQSIHVRNAIIKAIRKMDVQVLINANVHFAVLETLDAGIYGDASNDLRVLRSLGFNVIEPLCISSTIQAIVTAIAIHRENPEQLVYPIHSFYVYPTLYSSRKQLAGKPKANWGTEVFVHHDLRLVEVSHYHWSVIKNEIVLKVGFEPIRANGQNISEALVNVADFVNHDIGIGDKILIKIDEEGLAHFYKLWKFLRVGAIQHILLPTQCPRCKREVVVEDYGKKLSCKAGCYNEVAKSKELLSFVSANGFNVPGIDSNLAFYLVRYGFVKEMTDLFRFDRYKTKLLTQDIGLTSRDLNKISTEINKAKNISLAKFIWALRIDGLSEAGIKTLLSKYSNIYEVSKATREDLLALPTFGEKRVNAIISYFADPWNIRFIQHLIDLGVEIGRTK